MYCAPRFELIQLVKAHENKQKAWITFTTSNKKPKGKERVAEMRFLKGFMRLQDTALIGKITGAKKTHAAAIRYQKRAINQLVKAVHHVAEGADFEFLQNEANFGHCDRSPEFVGYFVRMIWFYKYCVILIKFSNLRKALFWVCFVAINILALSPAPYLPPEIFNWWDKAQHAIAFGTLAVLAVLAYPLVSKLRIALLLIGQGVLIEVLQHYGGYRFGDWQDAVADGVGVLLGMWGIAWLMRVEWFRSLMRL